MTTDIDNLRAELDRLEAVPPMRLLGELPAVFRLLRRLLDLVERQGVPQ